MVVMSPECMSLVPSSAADDEFYAKSDDGGDPHLASPTRKFKITIKYGKKKANNTEEKQMPSSFQRRASSRIAEKEQLVRRRVELLNDHNDEAELNSKKKCLVDGNGSDQATQQGHSLQVKVDKAGDGTGPPNFSGKSDYAKVKETLRLFNKYYLHFVQEEGKRCSKEKSYKKVSKNSKSKKVALSEDKKGKAQRPDLKAITKMMETKEILYPGKTMGYFPGVIVGHQFFSRAEMVVLGFHCHWMNGIDYMGNAYRKGEYSNYTFPLAVSIVLSGQYEDDLDNAEDIVYTGQGGHNMTGDRRQIRDQVMERGNLALKNCVEQCVPVRVVRGHDSASSYCRKVYTYDGLYKVVHSWAEKGISGFTVFKFRLRRLDGQSPLTTNQVQFASGRVPQSLSEIRGLVCEDITGGEEDVPIPATNLVDDPPIAPTGYTYLKHVQIAKNVNLPPIAVGCNCNGICLNPNSCSCARLNGSNFPYVNHDGGRLIEAKAVVFECGPKCGCGPACVNRTSQRGLKFRLEVFRTPKKGWAVRCWDFIPSGSPLCEYTGVLRRTDDVDTVSGNDYIFDIDCLQTMSGADGRQRRSCNSPIPEINSLQSTDECRSESVPEFCIDAGRTGNIARFINHSCCPNLFVQCVLSTHHDIKLARVMLFAADNIPPLQELTYDYGYVLDSVSGPDGKVKQLPCYCGAADCRKRLY